MEETGRNGRINDRARAEASPGPLVVDTSEGKGVRRGGWEVRRDEEPKDRAYEVTGW